MRITDIILQESEQHVPSDEFLKYLKMWVMNDDFDQVERKKMAEVFEREMPATPYGYTVYRGLNLESRKELHPDTDIFNLDTISFPGFTSASFDQSVVENNFLYASDEGLYIFFEIQTMGGARAIEVRDYSKYFKEDEDNYNLLELMEQEQELILPPGSRFKITDMQEIKQHNSDGKFEDWHVDLEQVG